MLRTVQIPETGCESIDSARRKSAGWPPFIFRGRRGELVKMLWATDDGLWLLAKRLERSQFIWSQDDGVKIHLTSVQLSML
ncbi:MAG: IS66 family insertion sequence element accessory protein TnpB [Burkholderia sp.]